MAATQISVVVDVCAVISAVFDDEAADYAAKLLS
jgi:hypothetical protein